MTDQAKKPEKVQALTERLARTLPPGEYQDKDTKALRFYVSDKGVRSFGVYKWSPAAGKDGKGAPVRIAIGRHPERTVEAARKLARDYSAKLADGEDPRLKPKARSQDPTLREITRTYTAELQQEGRKRWYWVERIVMGHKGYPGSYEDWLDLPLSAITRTMVDQRHRQIAFGDKDHEKRGPEAANASLKALRAIFAFAEKKELYAGKNVAKLVDKEKSTSRERVLSNAEYEAIIKALDDPQFLPYVRPYFRLLMLTGARKSNMAAARWADIDLEQAVWTIPPSSSKNGREMRVHLRQEAIDLFEAQLKAQAGDPSEWVFPTPSGADSGHIEEVWPVWKTVLKVAEVKSDITIHDLRRTFGSRLLNDDTPMEVVAKLLGHRNAATTAKHYAFLQDATVKGHLNRVRG